MGCCQDRAKNKEGTVCLRVKHAVEIILPMKPSVFCKLSVFRENFPQWHH